MHHPTLQEALVAWQSGDYASAEALSKDILARKPDNPDVINLRAVILFQSGQKDAAIELMRQLAAMRPTAEDVQNNLGYALHQMNRLDEAVTYYEKAIALAPNFFIAIHNLGDCYFQLENEEQAMACYEQALKLQPNNALVINNQGNLLRSMGKNEAALACYQRALQIQPGYNLPLNNMGLIFSEQGDINRAIRCYRQALIGVPNDKVLRNLAHALTSAHALDEALPCYIQAWSVNKENFAALGSIILVKQNLCDWKEPYLSLIDNLLAAVEQPSNDPVSPFGFLSLSAPTSPEQQLRCATAFSQQYEVNSPYQHQPPTRHPERLRIGYLSADYRTHATTSLIAELFSLHDRADFKVIAYSLGDDDGAAMRQHMAETADEFVDLHSMTDRHATQRINQDGIHILIDLKGHTQDARTKIMHWRPAPVQVNWLGYPGTMGSACFDYILTDAFITPPGQEPYFSEKIIRLPGCYQINDRQREVGATPSRSACGLPETAFVFCCFNQSYKITPQIFDIWMALLRKIPNSVLWLLESNSWSVDNLRTEAGLRGVSPQRIIFAPKLGRAEHLARYRLADLCLDTFPVTSHTTASDALWVGCPLLTCAGESFVSRVAGSLLTNVGLEELITYSLDDYGNLALELALQPDRLQIMRSHLCDKRDTFSLFDSRLFVKNLEDSYRDMWADWQETRNG